MKEYTILRKQESLDWTKIPALQIDCLLWTPDVPISAEARLCYDEEAIHVCLSAREPNIRAENTGLLDFPYEDSCLEFFFSPMQDDPRYINIEINPNGCMFLGMGGPSGFTRLLPAKPVLDPQICRTEDGWSLTYAVPCSLIRQFFPGFQPVPGGSIRANCYKCGDMTVQPHYLAWNPISLPAPNFHCPEYFGLMKFE